jgi:serine/threonine protein kinase
LRGYEILEEVGRGALSAVYRARRHSDGQVVALKILSAAAVASHADRARFLAEARTLALFQHPNIVRILEVGESQGMPYFTLELMDRGSLATALGGSPLPPRYAAELLLILCRAVQDAHSHGILHRDIKPGNVLLATPGEESPGQPHGDLARLLGTPKLTDFGIAKQIGEDKKITHTGAVIGTPAYMAPEQAEGRTRQATRAVDIYALGAVLYECLTGKPPYEAPTVLETLDLVRNGDPVPPDRVNPELPAPLVTICLKAMAREPESRYPSAAAMAEDLSRFLADLPVLASREPGYSRAWRWARRHPAVTMLSLGLASVSLALVTTLAVLGRRPPPPPPPREVEYFCSVVRRHGKPEGVFRLSPDQLQRREVSFRFRYSGGRASQVEAIDRFGRLTASHSFAAFLERGDPSRPWRREVRWEYQYDNDGNITRETALDRTGQTVWSFRYTTPTTGHYVDKRGFPRPRAGSGAAYVSFVLDGEGLVKELRYLGANGKPLPDRNGIFGQRLEHGRLGFVTTVTMLGYGDQPVLHPDGYASEARSYDDRGNLTEISYVGLDALPALGPGGYARRTIAHDADGNPTEMRAYGLDGTLIRNRDGYAIEKRAYDGQGRLANVAYFDTQGQPVADWLRVARTEYSYSEDGRSREERFFDVEGKPARHRFLCCTRLSRTIDEEGHEAEVVAHDLDLSLRRDLRFALAAPRVKRKHDERGNVIEESYFTVEGKPALSWFGVHRMKVAYDDRGHRVEMRFEDQEGKPAVPRSRLLIDFFSGAGPAVLRWIWDENGDNTEVQALTLEGKPDDTWSLALVAALGYREGETVLPAGVARVRCRFDERGNRTEVSHLNAKGEILDPVRGRQGVTRGRLTLAYDKHGNVTEAALYQRDGQLAKEVGPPRVTVQYDDDGRPIDCILFGPEGRFSMAGVSRYRFTYDQQGNRTSEAFFDSEDQPAPGPSGYARATYRYDTRGNLTESQFHDAEGKPVTTRVVVTGRDPFPAFGPPMGMDPAPIPLEAGDVLLTYDGQPISSTLQLYDLKRREDPGRKGKPAEVLRGGTKAVVTLPAGFPGGDPFGDLRRRGGRGPGGSPFWFLRSLPGQGLTPPLSLGDVRLRTEVIP